jgi:outer membrane protein assembly factor BamB
LLAGCRGRPCSTRPPGTGGWSQVGGDARHTGVDASHGGIREGANHWTVTHDSALAPAGLAVAGDRLVVAGRRGTSEGFLQLRSLADGDLLEAFDLPLPVSAPPAVADGSVVVACRSAAGENTYRGYGFDGTEQWASEPSGGRLAAPTVAGGTVYGAGDDGTVVALGAGDGAVGWQRRIADEREGGAVYGPVAVDDSRVYVPVSCSSERGIHALSREDGRTLWEVPGPRVESMLVRTGDLLLASYFRYELVAFDASTGERRWSRGFDGPRLSPPAVTGDVAVVAGPEALHGLDAATGDERWSLACEPDTAQPTVAGDTVLAAAEEGLVGCSLAGQRRFTAEDASGPVVPVEHGFIHRPGGDTLAAYTECQG